MAAEAPSADDAPTPDRHPLEGGEHDVLDDEPDQDQQEQAGEDPVDVELVAVLVDAGGAEGPLSGKPMDTGREFLAMSYDLNDKI
jgi:hypothetical protein